MSPTADIERTSRFEAQRLRLRGLAYRMLGSYADAEDVVQEAWLRWQAADRSQVRAPRAFLSQTVTRLCLDRIKSAQAQREVYVGPWLPEPLLQDEEWLQEGPEAATEFASDVSYAFLLALERLSPLERAAFLLHDVFDIDFAEVAASLGRTPAGCRQLATRARAQLRASAPRFKVAPEQSQRLATAFAGALGTGDIEALKSLLTADTRFVSDGGGRVAAAGRPVLGADKVAKALIGFTRHLRPDEVRVLPARVNGMAGFVIVRPDGSLIQTLALEIDDAHCISAIYVVRNPEKLQHLGPFSQ